MVVESLCPLRMVVSAGNVSRVPRIDSMIVSNEK
jgi:hypothetical protein